MFPNNRQGPTSSGTIQDKDGGELAEWPRRGREDEMTLRSVYGERAPPVQGATLGPVANGRRLGTQSVCSRLGIELGRIRHPTRKGSVIGQDRRCSTKGQAELQKLFVGSRLELVRDVFL